MLNGIAPIIIFTFKKNVPVDDNGIPVVEDEPSSIPLIPIPIYLDEKITGIYIQSESKNIDINTEPQTKTDGSDPSAVQSPINSSITINMIASSTSIGLTILMAMSDLIFSKVTSKEYSITYIHGAITVFGGLLQGFSVNQNNDNDLYNITLSLSNAVAKATKTAAAASTVTVPVSDGPIPNG